MVYAGNGGLTVVADYGKRADILTGSILAEGSSTGICRGDADVGVSLPTTEKEGPDGYGPLDPTNKKSGAVGPAGGLLDTCDPEVVAEVGDECVITAPDAHNHCTKKHTGVHVVVTGGRDTPARIGGAGEN